MTFMPFPSWSHEFFAQSDLYTVASWKLQSDSDSVQSHLYRGLSPLKQSSPKFKHDTL